LLSRVVNIFKSDELRGKFARGGVILSVGSFAEIFSRFLRNVILTKLLAPDLLGMFATIHSVVLLTEAFTEVGVRQAIIQNKKGGSSDFVNVAWWFSAIRGLLLYAAAYLAAPTICGFYARPDLLVPMRAAFVVILLHGLVSPRMYVLEKEMRFFKYAIMKQGVAVLNVAVAVVFSLFYKSCWPLIAGLIVEFASTFVLSFLLVPFKPRFSIDRASFSDIMFYARRMIGLPLFTSIFLQFDVLIVPKFFSFNDAGLYAVARGFALMPILAFTKTIRPMVLPAFSKMQDSKEKLKEAILKSTDLTVVVSGPFVAFCIVFAAPLLSFLYKPKYAAVAAAFAILMLYVVIRLLSTILMQLYFALAKPELQRRFSLTRLAVIALMIYPAIEVMGFDGVPTTVAAGMLTVLVMQIFYAGSLVGLRPVEYCKSLVRGSYYSGAVVLGGLAVRHLFEGPDLIALVMGGAFCLAAWAVALSTAHYKMILLGNRN